MNELNLVKIARELLAIHEDFPFRLKNPMQWRIGDFEMETFTQTWGNTSGGFETIGGDAITEQRVYVFVPVSTDENCFVYFGGRFAYEVPFSQIFMTDIRDRKVAGLHHKSKYFSKE